VAGLSLRYSLRNLAVRRVRTALTGAVIALVVVATALFVALVHSLQTSLVSSGHPRNLVVLRKGADNDGSSSLSLEAFQAIRFFEGIAQDAQGEPLASPEVVVQPFFEVRGGGRENVLVRGVEPIAFAVHDDVRIAQGRKLAPASGEAMVGRGVATRYAGAALGSELRFGRGTWKVVGILESGGSSFESEVWVDARELASDARRPVPYSGFRVRAAPGADMEALARRIADDPRWALEAQPETEYYAAQSSAARMLYVIVIGIALLAGTGAVFGASNTLYAAVQARTAEIGTLRALGFSRFSIARAFLIEAGLLALGGFAVGAVAAWGLAAAIDSVLGGVSFPMRTFTTSVILLRVTGIELAVGLGLAMAIGLLGGLAPAVRASRMRPVEALRRA
jgi:ABC-type lipoprotein release transport system permease subunit